MARPRKIDAARSVIRIRITDAVRRDLDVMACLNGHRSISALIREAVNEYVADCREDPAAAVSVGQKLRPSGNL